MDIDMQVLRSIERDKDIPFDVLVAALTDAIENAYAKSASPVKGARVVRDPKTGKVSVWAPELDEEGNVGEYEDTPEGFGRVAASTARQVIFRAVARGGRRAEVRPLLRQRGGHPHRRRPAGPGQPHRACGSRAHRGDHAAGRTGAGGGVHPRQAPAGVRGDGATRAARPSGGGGRGRTPTWCSACSSLRFPRIESGVVEIKAVAREAGHRTKIAVVSQTPTCPPRAPASGRWASGCAR